MPANKKLLILPGDGIGPEVMHEVRRVVDWMDRRRAVSFDIAEDLVGGAAIDAHGSPIADRAMQRALEADAVLFGAVGGPKWDSLGFDRRPELAILRLRSELGLFANLRPAIVYDPLVDASTLKAEVVRGLDVMIVRESTGGIYFGTPRGVETLPDGTKRGINTEVYTTPEIERVARVAFELARKRQNRVCSVEKANVMESGLLWRQTVQALHDAEYQDVALSHMYADNCAMQLVRNPRQFDVIVTGNLFGDLLSDLHADRLARHAAFRDARPARRVRPPARAVRADPRQRAGHRRQGRRQPAGADPQLRHAAALLVRHGRGCGADRAGLHQRAGQRPAHAGHHGPGLCARRHRGDGRGGGARAGQARGLSAYGIGNRCLAWRWARWLPRVPASISTEVPRNTARMPTWPPTKPPASGPTTCPTYWADTE